MYNICTRPNNVIINPYNKVHVNRRATPLSSTGRATTKASLPLVWFESKYVPDVRSLYSGSDALLIFSSKFDIAGQTSRLTAPCASLGLNWPLTDIVPLYLRIGTIPQAMLLSVHVSARLVRLPAVHENAVVMRHLASHIVIEIWFSYIARPLSSG